MSKPLPEVLVRVLQEQFPQLLAADLDGKDVVLLMPDEKGELVAFHYIATDDFLMAVRVAESSLDNLATLCCGEGDFDMRLLPPEPDSGGAA
jgi:hypothetical protein